MPLLSAKNKKRRLQFAEAHQNWTIVDCKTLPGQMSLDFCCDIQMVGWLRQQDNAPCHKAQIISDWFLEHDNEFTLLKWPPQSPDLNHIEHVWDAVEREISIMDVQSTNLQQLCDAIMSIWTKISEDSFLHLVESMPQRIKAVLKAKGGPTRY